MRRYLWTRQLNLSYILPSLTPTSFPLRLVKSSQYQSQDYLYDGSPQEDVLGVTSDEVSKSVVNRS